MLFWWEKFWWIVCDVWCVGINEGGKRKVFDDWVGFLGNGFRSVGMFCKCVWRIGSWVIVESLCFKCNGYMNLF